MVEPELTEILDTTRAVTDEVIAPRAQDVDTRARWPEEGLRALLDAGLGGLMVPTAHGGLGQGLLSLLRVCEEIGRECASTAMCFGMHHVATAVVATKVTDELAGRFLVPIAGGRHLTTLALSEPGTGAHFYLPQTRLERRNGTLHLTGTKSFVTNGSFADSYVVSVHEEGSSEADPGTFSMLMLPGDTPGVGFGSPWQGFGMRGNASCNMTLGGVDLAEDLMLGATGDQLFYVFHVVAPYFLAAMAGTYLGVARRALEVALESLRGRAYEHSGRFAADEPVLQHRLGQLWGRCQSARHHGHWAALEFDRAGPEALPAVLSMKAEIADAATTVVNEASTLAGGRAYAGTTLLQRLLRDVRAAHVMSPTTDLLRVWTGRALLGRPILGG